MKEFGSFGAFAAELAIIHGKQEHSSQKMLNGVGKIIERTAKKKIGEYQAQTGQFAGWAELADATKRDRERQGYPEDEPGLRSGEMRDSISHFATAEAAHIGSNDDKLVWFELGTDKQPPRSVLGGAAFEREREIVEIIGEEFTLLLAGEEVHHGGMLIDRD